jgi:tetratricopeptide (TPR) repeat protein
MDQSRSLTVCVALALAFAGGLASPVVAGQSRDGSAYLELVDRYQRGEHDAAVAAFMLWSLEDVRAVRSADLVSEVSVRRQRAILLLHTEAILQDGSMDALLPTAERAAFTLSARGEKSDTEFLVLWRIVTVSYLLRTGRTATAERLVGRADLDPRLLLLDGSIKEFQASDGWSGLAPLTAKEGMASSRWSEFGFQDNKRRTALLAAEARFKRTIEISPELVEARLRLGRVLAILGRTTAARTELERAFNEASHSFLKYMAALFLGGVAERDGRAEAARTHYLAAVSEYPEAQTARLALGHLLESRGRTEEGWDEVRRIFTSPDSPGGSARDPWWVYRLGQHWQSGRLIDQLREAVRQ